jgi:hypothetical protein
MHIKSAERPELLRNPPREPEREQLVETTEDQRIIQRASMLYRESALGTRHLTLSIFVQ